MSVVGRGLESGFLPVEDVKSIAREGLARLPLDGRRVLVLVPDGTRTMPMPLLFDVLDEAVGPRAAALAFLVAHGTHAAMSDDEIESAEAFEALELAAERVDLVRDEREKNAVCLVRTQDVHGAAQFRGGDLRLLEIDAGETVDLEVEERRLKVRQSGKCLCSVEF